MVTYYKGPITDHFDGKKFYNPWNPYLHSLFSVIRWKLTSTPKIWPQKVENQFLESPLSIVAGSGLRVTYVGHSTALIQTHGLNILTDPIWSKRASPFTWIGPERISEPGISFELLPKIDLILISHNHYDHLDLETIKSIWDRDKPKIIVPLGNDTIIHFKDPSIEVVAIDWNQSISIKNGFNVYLEPSQHWSGRSLFFDRNKALWGSFVVDIFGDKIYFSGDTGYGNGNLFNSAREKFGPFRLALLPIGAYEPRWFMKYAHMNPEDAVHAYEDLGRPFTMGLHLQTFHLSDEGFMDPIEDMAKIQKKFDIPKDRFRILDIGEKWDIPLLQ